MSQRLLGLLGKVGMGIGFLVILWTIGTVSSPVEAEALTIAQSIQVTPTPQPTFTPSPQASGSWNLDSTIIAALIGLVGV
ncbi:MAG TPA: hypothetical protein VEP90_16890, partial [Methylomirabilota bacterium]|nr:hypothetical protein [Methylomirabilota bacterium]